MQDDGAHHPMATAGEDAPQPIAFCEVWRWAAPWVGHVLLTVFGIFGLATASGAPDRATYDVGIATFLLAVAILALRFRQQLDGREIGLLLPVTVQQGDTLVVTIAVLMVLGLVGVVLAATVGGVLYGVGLALFVICVAVIFFNIKRYFDVRDRAG